MMRPRTDSAQLRANTNRFDDAHRSERTSLRLDYATESMPIIAPTIALSL
jgi:hypothetical protein